MVIYPGPRKANVLQSEMETDKFNKFMEQNICNVHVFKQKEILLIQTNLKYVQRSFENSK